MSLATLKTKVEQLIVKAQNGGGDFVKNLIEGNFTTLNIDVATIRTYAFKNCTKLTKVVAPNVTAIASYAFDGCTNLTEVSFPSISYFSGTCCFNNCKSLVSVDMPNMYIAPNQAFANSGLTEIHFESLRIIDPMVFMNCKSATSIYLPKLEKVNNSAFSNCTGLTEITFYKVMTSFVNTAFSGCTNIESVTIPEGWNISCYFHYSEKLTRESLHAMIENLADMSTAETAPTFQIGSTNFAKLDEEHIAMLDTKGWVTA